MRMWLTFGRLFLALEKDEKNLKRCTFNLLHFILLFEIRIWQNDMEENLGLDNIEWHAGFGLVRVSVRLTVGH